jgi:hypothetical protein
MMTISLIIVGLVSLVMLAITIGATADQQAQTQAWRHIAVERRRNQQRRRDLEELLTRCPKADCPLRSVLEPPPDRPPPHEI